MSASDVRADPDALISSGRLLAQARQKKIGVV